MTDETPVENTPVEQKKKNVEVVLGKRHGRKRSGVPKWKKAQNSIARYNKYKRAKSEMEKQEKAKKASEREARQKDSANMKFCPKCSNLRVYNTNDTGQIVCSICGFNPKEA